MGDGEGGGRDCRGEAGGGGGLEGRIWTRAVGDDFEGIIGGQMEKAGDREGDIRIRILEGLKGGRLGKIRSIQAEPDLYDFFVEIINDELTCEDDVIVSCVFGDQLRGRGKEKPSCAKRRGEGESAWCGKVGLCGSVLGRRIVGEISSWSLWAHHTGGARGTRSEGAGIARSAHGARGAGGARSEGAGVACGTRGAGWA